MFRSGSSGPTVVTKSPIGDYIDKLVMSVVSVQRGFSPSTATLSSVAQRLLEALQNETIGTPLVSHLSPTFVADFTAQIALVAKLDADQHGATG